MMVTGRLSFGLSGFGINTTTVASLDKADDVPDACLIVLCGSADFVAAQRASLLASAAKCAMMVPLPVDQAVVVTAVDLMGPEEATVEQRVMGVKTNRYPVRTIGTKLEIIPLDEQIGFDHLQISAPR